LKIERSYEALRFLDGFSVGCINEDHNPFFQPSNILAKRFIGSPLLFGTEGMVGWGMMAILFGPEAQIARPGGEFEVVERA
jgi:hypothetical protein